MRVRLGKERAEQHLHGRSGCRRQVAHAWRLVLVDLATFAEKGGSRPATRCDPVIKVWLGGTSPLGLLVLTVILTGQALVDAEDVAAKGLCVGREAAAVAAVDLDLGCIDADGGFYVFTGC